jgi:putative transposase
MTETTLRAIKYRIYPDTQQRTLIAKTIGCTRFVYNHMLALSRDAYSRGEKFCSRNSFNYQLTRLKQEYDWLAEVDATALTAANDHLASAFRSFFDRRAGFPKFHKKHVSGSYTSKRIQKSNNIAVGDNYVRLPKLGLVKAKIHKAGEPDWVIKSATVSVESDGKYYAAVTYEFERTIPQAHSIVNAIGLDYASDGLYVDDRGNVGTNHKYYRESYKKLAREQRRLSRKRGSRKNEPKSHNYKKQLLKVNKIYSHIANQRRDNLQKISTEIANQYDIVCVESLNMRSMANKGFGNGKATLDNGYGLFLNMLAYKLADRGKYFVKVDKWFPSSQICHACGAIHPEMKDLKIRTMKCDCGLSVSRDQNAAINIKNEGLRMLKAS